MNGAVDIEKTIDEANAQALRRIITSDPVLVDVHRAGDVIPGLPDHTILHAGPPITWERMCGSMRGAVLGAIIYEGWAPNIDAAGKLAASGKIAFQPNHHFNAVGPMTGMLTKSMPVMIVENRTFGNRAFTTINEGRGNVMRFGGNNDEVIARLRWMADVLAPALSVAIKQRDGIGLKGLVARALTMGDELHMRNAAGSTLIFRELAPALAKTCGNQEVLADIIDFIGGNDMFFLNVAMATAKSMSAAAINIEYSTIVTTMCRNGTDFGIRVSGTGDAWFTAPAEVPVGLFFPGFSEQDANPDMGDSCIVETVGLGGFAMASSPAVVGFLGAGGFADALNYTRSMSEIASGSNPDWTLPTMDFVGVPTGIDIRKVLQTGIRPVINTAIIHRLPALGQVGAGVVRAPQACFEQALGKFAETIGVAA